MLEHIQIFTTKVFMYSSLAFGVAGVSLVMMADATGDFSNFLREIFLRTLITCVFVILPSFALSIAGKFLLTTKEARHGEE